MQGVDVIIIDPENEYRSLAEATGGRFFSMRLIIQRDNSRTHRRVRRGAFKQYRFVHGKPLILSIILGEYLCDPQIGAIFLKVHHAMNVVKEKHLQAVGITRKQRPHASTINNTHFATGAFVATESYLWRSGWLRLAAPKRRDGEHRT
jgi:hypothetical protein